MKHFKLKIVVGLCLLALLSIQCDKDALLSDDFSDQNVQMKSSNAKSSDGESAGNNLSYPVIWSDGASLALRGERWLAPKLDGEWWYVWGDDPIDPQATLFSCQPNPANLTVCLDGTPPGDGGEFWKAFVQKDPLNEWQAWNYNGANDDTWVIDLIDWGDNLESVDWTIASQVRTEVVLYHPVPEVVVFPPGEEPYYREYAMRHAFGWGITEVHGLQTYTDNTPLPPVEGSLATVYSPNARLTIQKINVESLDEIPAYIDLDWDPAEKGWDNPLFNAPIFNMAVYEGGDGPGYYSAEVNVKGKVIYGYTWNVRRMNEGIGYYRITFSFDNEGSPVTLNTDIDGTTEILLPLEEDIEAAIASALFDKNDEADDDGGDTGGAIAVRDEKHHLTYIDVLITDKQRGAGGGNGGGGDGNPGGGSGGGKDGNIGNGSGSSGNGAGTGTGSGSGLGKGKK